MSRKSVKVSQLLQARANRETRLGTPLVNFVKTIVQCASAGELMLSGAIDPKIATLVERSAVISTVTAVEVYYRDTLNLIFRNCDPAFFEPHLKQLFPEKFDISELIEIYRHRIHPLELILSAQSFQNLDRIDQVFSRFLSGGLLGNIVGLSIRRKGDPGEGATLTQDDLAAVKCIFALRHELVHDPALHSFFIEKTLNDIWSTGAMVLSSDIMLMKGIKDNRDPELSSLSDA